MEKVRKELDKKWNDLLGMGLSTSWLGFLRTCYEVACENKNYIRASLIQDLIIEDINS